MSSMMNHKKRSRRSYGSTHGIFGMFENNARIKKFKKDMSMKKVEDNE